MYSKVLSLKGGIVNRANKEENLYRIFFLSLSNESRTLPLHLWQLLALTHRNERFRDKGGDVFGPGLSCQSLRLKEDLFPRHDVSTWPAPIIGEETRAALQSAFMIDELTFLAALTWLHWPQAPIRCRFTGKRSRSAIRTTSDCRFRSRRCFETRSNDLFQFPAVITEILRQIFLPFSLFLSSFSSFFLFLFPLFTQFLTFFHAPSRSSFETDRRVHLLFLRSMLHDRLTYKPRTG